ncbi:hypothetical protein ACFQL7_13935 [Halocatena marina]|uniref:DUF8050 domain-containing protein n=1 Tax=Halocatena marina TaxID=2934937 RepID=A0ABD5YTI6_9EURY
MSTTAKRRLLIVLLLGLIPWTVVTVSGTVTLVLPFGLIDAQSWRLLTLPEYLRLSGGRVAPFIEAWPLSVFLYAGTLVSAIGGVFGREDPRLTGGFQRLPPSDSSHSFSDSRNDLATQRFLLESF